MKFTVLTLLLLLANFIKHGYSKDLYVRGQIDSSNQTFPTFQSAIDSSRDGDTIHLPGGVLRESGIFSNKENIIIEGNDTILDGAEPLPFDRWIKVEGNLHKISVDKTKMGRHMLIVNGKTQRMGMTPDKHYSFPEPEDLKKGEFSIVKKDKNQNWLYYNGIPKHIEYCVRLNGLATNRKNSGIIVRNLQTRHFLNDGFNIHGHSTNLVFDHIIGHSCFDEGFSAHDLSESLILNSTFYNNCNAVADVNDCTTEYRDCVFKHSFLYDVLFKGKKHTLINCTIENNSKAIALLATPAKPGDEFHVHLENTTIQGTKQIPAKVKVHQQVTQKNCLFKNAVLTTY